MHRINKRYLIVDGYNYINADSQLKAHLNTSLATSRKHLNDMLSEFVAYTGEIGIVVYDATKSNAKLRHEGRYKNIEIIFTKGRETADTYIEWRVRELLKDKTNLVRVITQDWAEQLVILGSGGIRVSSREWKREIEEMRRQLNIYKPSDTKVGSNQLDSVLDKQTIKKMWSMANKIDYDNLD